MKIAKLITLFFTLSCIVLWSCKGTKTQLADNNISIPGQLSSFLDGNSNSAQYIFVRHAEKQTGENPRLTTAGTQRAQTLALLLQQVNLDYIYSTNYKRTIETAEPTAKAKKLETKIYNPRDLEGFANMLVNRHTKHTVLVVGHSNTTPSLVNLVLGEERLSQFPESQYDDLILITDSGSGELKLTNLKFDQKGLLD